MEPLAIILVLFSAVCHAGWNYLAQAFRRPLVGMWLMTGIGLLIYLPVFVFTSRSLVLSTSLVVLIIASGLVKSGYYVTLAATYEHSDLSLGYPLSRTGIVLIPVWAYLFLGEMISPLAGVAIFVILAGVYVLNMGPLRLSKLLSVSQRIGPGLGAALATALLISVFSVIDKRAMVAPELGAGGFSYGGAVNFLYLMFVSTWLGVTPYVLATNHWAEIKQEMPGNLGRLVVMGLCDFTGYGAVLAAMELSKVSHILALRQVSIVLGAIMGAALLKEKYGPSRVLGATIIFIGAVLISISK